MHSRKLIPLFALMLGACAMDEEWDPADLEVTEEDMAADAELAALIADGKADADLTYNAVANLAKNAGITCSYERIAIAVAVAKAESGFDIQARNTAGNAHGVDRGLWQINSYWHPDVTNTCAYSASCNARAMYRISSRGTNWKPWWTYVNGKHWPYMTASRNAQRAVCGT
jgi:hypothetical protein